jgi:hypothetical protein
MTEELNTSVAEGLSMLANEALARYEKVKNEAELELAGLCLSKVKSSEKFQKFYLESTRLWEEYSEAACDAVEAWTELTLTKE